MRQEVIVTVGCCLAVLLAGCGGPVAPGATADDQTSVGTSTVTAGANGDGTPTASPATMTPHPAADWLGLPDCPERPSDFTAERAGEFARQFERARETRRVLQDERGLRNLSVDTESATGTEIDGGWLVRFRTETPYVRWNESWGGRHSDPARTVAHYYIGEDRIWRAHAIENVSPRQAGSVVHCPPVVD